MKTYGLDTNCFIDAVNPMSPSYGLIQRLLTAYRNGIILLKVSLHTVHELERRKDEALNLARTLPVLVHWPIGTWKEQVGTWEQQSGTWENGRQNDDIQLQLKELAKSGTDIRDRGAYIDSLCSGLDGFITSDKQLIGSGPAKRINARFPTKVLKPDQVLKELSIRNHQF